jgi:hypothetical protein
MSTEKKPVILFVDVLGVRSKWLSGGQPAAEAAFQEFRTLIAASMKGTVSDSLVRGVVESDSAALTFSSLLPALDAAKALYSAAFRRKRGRVWLRGCIVSLDGHDALRTSTTFSGKLDKIELNLYSKPLLEAIAVEKSGFKGMRLLVESSLINAEVRATVKQPIGHLNFIPLCKLKAMHYPKRIDRLFVDYLWMASIDRDEFDDMRSIMAVRLRGAAGDPEEFSQAAATQVVFHECGAILGSLGGKVHYRTLTDAERAEEEAAPKSNPVA